MHFFGIFLHAVGAVDIRTHHGIIVIHCLIHSNLVPHIHCLRPPTTAHKECQTVNIEFGSTIDLRCSVKQIFQTDFACGVTGLIKTHRPHGQPCKTTRAGVGNLLGISRNGRTGKNKLPQLSTMVDLKANGIPQLRCDLPLVDQPWCCTLQQTLWI